MANIAIFGFGVVGGGIACVLDENRGKIREAAGEEVNLKYILDLREFPDSPYGGLVVHEIDPILEDESVTVVCEAMGGVHPALEYSLKAMKAGKSVVTSNKEVVAKHGDELLAAAAENGVSYLYEAAVGGGIPVLRSLKTSLASERIARITGILNGTTNYIITKMTDDGASFADALAEAQSLGYAEANPTADVDGLDAQRKIIILSAIATGKLLSEGDVYAETMTRLTPADMDAAARLDASVKLLGCFRNGEKISAFVCPFIVPKSVPLANISDVYNGVWVEGETTGDVMYYGRGAGRYPTAGAMVSDVCAAVSGAAKFELPKQWTRVTDGEAESFAELSFKYYVRVKTSDRDSLVSYFENALGDVAVLSGGDASCCEIVTGEVSESKMQETLAGASMGECESVIRIF